MGKFFFAILLMITMSACTKSPPPEPIKVGILHSLTGTMAISEKSVVDAAMMAVEEINQKGGLLGRKIEPVVVDGRSDESTFAKEAERLIRVEKVDVVFGCWTSASRKAVKPVFEKYNHLLFYPVQYEGLEHSLNIIYTGAAPNQQIIPAVKWSFDNLGTKFFLVGSDYIFPRTANEIIRDHAAMLGAEIVGELYAILGSADFKDIVKKIRQAKPDVILNTINGDSNIAFFNALYESGNFTSDIPVMSFSITEHEIKFFGRQTSSHNGKMQDSVPPQMIGNYASWNYFQSVRTDENDAFVRKFKEKYGADRVLGDPMEAAYFGVYLWAQAVEAAGSSEVGEVRIALKRQSFRAPEGLVHIEAENNHTWKTVRIGKIRADGQFDIVWETKKPVYPSPYPPGRSSVEWDMFSQRLYKSWGGKWANPGR